jgi:hypothetical protein
VAHDVFISYSTKDQEVARAVCAALERRDMGCWVAPRDIVPGAEWGGAIVDAIAAARVLVLVFSRNSDASPQVLREVERAVHRRVPIIPLRIEDVPPSSSMQYYISVAHWLDATAPPLGPRLEQLAETVRSMLSSPAGRGGVPPPLPARPAPVPAVPVLPVPILPVGAAIPLPYSSGVGLVPTTVPTPPSYPVEVQRRVPMSPARKQAAAGLFLAFAVGAVAVWLSGGSDLQPYLGEGYNRWLSLTGFGLIALAAAGGWMVNRRPGRRVPAGGVRRTSDAERGP